jgi:alpha-methylacyl-CoA racemase
MPVTPTPQPLKGVRILSLALNLPGPAALLRLQAMGARCSKIEPPGGDPMAHYNAAAYADLQQGIRVLQADLKSDAGQALLQRELARTDVLLTSFRPSALTKLGLGWNQLQQRSPGVSLVAIVGAPGPLAEVPGHDLTYLAEAGLVPALDLPPSLLADMGGALLASEAVLQALLLRQQKRQKLPGRTSAAGTPSATAATPRGVQLEVALSSAAAWLALPRQWGLTVPGQLLGGAHAGYRVYPCRGGRVAVAALEPHFAARLCALMGLADEAASPARANTAMLQPATHQRVASFMATRTRAQLDKLASQHDVPLLTLPR